jgi:hypothetical protein
VFAHLFDVFGKSRCSSTHHHLHLPQLGFLLKPPEVSGMNRTNMRKNATKGPIGAILNWRIPGYPNFMARFMEKGSFKRS